MKKVCHIQKSKVEWKEKSGDNKFILGSVMYWCGKTEEFVNEDQPPTKVERLEQELFEAKQEEKPWPICRTCRKNKDKMG